MHTGNALTRESTYPDPVRTEWKILARTRITAPDMSLREIAQRLGYSYHTIRRWLTEPAYQRFENYILERQVTTLMPELAPESISTRVREKYTAYSEEMQQRLYDIIESTEDNKLAADLCQDWLDRAGFAPIRKEQKLGISLTLTADAIEALRQRAREAGL